MPKRPGARLRQKDAEEADDLGGQLRQARVEAGLTVASTAARTCYSASHLNNVEAGAGPRRRTACSPTRERWPFKPRAA
ncbi:helix-turn-helix domain-containing protein [Micromonospora psammae]|uniref:helix-turn-helix domain-containing protein n=1 Tax=Micromonospora sp. CPCC 205556 TaxID=3122398 RepID=UPI003FA5591A